LAVDTGADRDKLIFIMFAVEVRLKAEYKPVRIAISLEPLGDLIEQNAYG
jgi:hypothetical protein